MHAYCFDEILHNTNFMQKSTRIAEISTKFTGGGEGGYFFVFNLNSSVVQHCWNNVYRKIFIMYYWL